MLAITKLALEQIGVEETPIGSNNVKYNTAYYGKPVQGSQYSWCAVFIWWLTKEVGEEYPISQKSVYCPYIMAEAKNKGIWVSPSEIKEGDWVLLGKNGNAAHIGLCVGADGNLIHTIEGNTGDKVQRKSYAIKTATTVLGGVKRKYKDSPPDAESLPLTERAIRAINKLVDKHRIDSPDLWLQRIKNGDTDVCWLFIKWAEDIV